MSDYQQADLHDPEASDVSDDTEDDGSFVVDLDGFAGPLDLLLQMARKQKVDLERISVLELADQYLCFLQHLRQLRLDIAADYLIMAAWLIYLKSRLLLPQDSAEDEASPDEVAARLTFRLQRLSAMRDAAKALMARHRLGQDVFSRGEPESLQGEETIVHADSLYDLLSAYADRRQSQAVKQPLRIARPPVWPVNEARLQLHRLTEGHREWRRLDHLLASCSDPATPPRSVVASGFAASLELAREGMLDINQTGPYQPIHVRGEAPASHV